MMLRNSLTVVVAALALPLAVSGIGLHLMPPGERMEAESWPMLPADSPVTDPYASGDQAVLLARDGGGMGKSFKLHRSYYALSIWARARQENTYQPPAYLTLQVNDVSYRIRVRYNLDRAVYQPGYLCSYLVDKHAGYEFEGDFAKARNLIPNPHAKAEWRGENTRFYFPIQAASDVTLTLKLDRGSGVDLLIDKVELRDVLAHLPAGPTKKRRVLISDEALAAWAKLRQRDPRARALIDEIRERPNEWAAWDDAALWDFVPNPYYPRSQRAGICPVHGDEVFRRGGIANPWRVGPQFPQVRCLVGDEVYPSPEYADDGWGHFLANAEAWDPTDRNIFFVGRASYSRWQTIPTSLARMAEHYLLTGDETIAHKAGIVLAAVASYYPGYDYRFQSKRGLFGHGHGGNTGIASEQMEPWEPDVAIYNDWGCGKIFYCGWTGGPDHEFKLMVAYDLLFPALIKDAELLAFVGARLPWVQTFADLQELFDRYLLAVHSDALIRRQAKSANSGWEASAATLGAIQDGLQARRMLEALLTRANLDGTDAGGFADASINMLNADGVGLIYSPMYLFGWANGLSAAGLLASLTDPDLRQRLAPAVAAITSRIAGMTRFARDIRVAGQFLPNVGDTSRANAHNADQFLTDVWPLWLRQWQQTRDPQFAALTLRFAPQRSLLLEHGDVLPLLEADAALTNGDLQRPSRVLNAYGAVVLESGAEQSELNQKGAVFLPFGAGWGHAHDDALNIELFAHGYRLLPDKGRLHAASIYHNVVRVDNQDQTSYNLGNRPGWLNHFAVAPGVRFADVGARPHNYEQVDRYRRILMQVDAAVGNYYLLDIFQVDGGSDHQLGLHGPPSVVFTSTPPLGAAGDLAAATYSGDKFANPREVAQPLPEAVTLDWQFLFGASERKNDPESTDVHIRAMIWGAAGGRLTAADVTGDIPFSPTGVHLHRHGENLRSNFVTVLEPYVGQPFITSVTPVAVSGVRAEESAALVVDLNDGRRDLLVHQGAARGRDTQLAVLPDQELTTSGLRFDGVAAMVRRTPDGAVGQAMLIGGTVLETDGLKLEAVTAAYATEIVDVDFATGELTLAAPLPTAANLAGSEVVIGSASRSRTYELAKVSTDGRKIMVVGGLRIFQSRVLAADAATGEIEVEFPFYRCLSDPVVYNGRVASNESMTALWRVAEVRRDSEDGLWRDARQATLVPLAPAPAGFQQPATASLDRFDDADGDGRRQIYVFDIAPGDRFRLTTFVHVARQADGELRTTANVACRVTAQ